MFGLLQDDPQPRLEDRLGKGASYLGGVKVAASDVTVSVGVEGAPLVSVTATIDFYTDAEGNTHIVLGTIQPDGTWEIVSDFTLPF